MEGKKGIIYMLRPRSRALLFGHCGTNRTGDLKAAREAARHLNVEEVARIYESRVRSTLVAIVCPPGGAADRRRGCLFSVGPVGPKRVAAQRSCLLTETDEVLVVRQAEAIYILLG